MQSSTSNKLPSSSLERPRIQQETPFKDGSFVIFRGNIPKDEASWQDFFKNNQDLTGDFQGNPVNASILMSSFAKGRKCLEDFLADKREFISPDLWIMDDEDSPSRVFAFDYKKPDEKLSQTVVSKNALAEASLIDPSEVIPLQSIFGNMHLNTLKDTLFLLGIEETHHALFWQFTPEEQLGGGGRVIQEGGTANFGPSEDEYYATETEWQALGFKIKFAREFNLTLGLQTLLKMRDRSAVVRESKGLPVDKIPFLDLG